MVQRFIEVIWCSRGIFVPLLRVVSLKELWKLFQLLENATSETDRWWQFRNALIRHHTPLQKEINHVSYRDIRNWSSQLPLPASLCDLDELCCIHCWWCTWSSLHPMSTLWQALLGLTLTVFQSSLEGLTDALHWIILFLPRVPLWPSCPLHLSTVFYLLCCQVAMQPEFFCLFQGTQVRLELGLRCISTSQFKPSYLYSSVDGGHFHEIKVISLLQSLAVMAVFGWAEMEPEAFLFASCMGTEVRCGASFTKLLSKQS